MSVFHYGKPVFVIQIFQNTALIKDEGGCERQVPLRTLKNKNGTSYDELYIPPSIPPDVFADLELARAGKQSLKADKKPHKHDTLCA